MAPPSKARGLSLANGQAMTPVKSGWAGFVLYHADVALLEVESHKGDFIYYPDVSQEEFKALLDKHGIQYDERYLWK